jgi:hypothetical protein
MDGGANGVLGDRALINGDNTTETFRIYAVSGTANATQRSTIVTTFGALNANTEVVVVRGSGNLTATAALNTTNFAVVAELDNIEEYTINLAGQQTGFFGIPIGTQRVQVFGDFTATSLRTNTITVTGEGAIEVDVTGIESEHRVVLDTNDANSSIIGQRPQDMLNCVLPDAPVDQDGGDTNEDAENDDTNEDAENGDGSSEDVSVDPTGAALQLGLSIVKDPVFAGDSETDVVLRRFGTEAEQGSKFYLALTAASLRDASINTLDVSVNLGETFGEVFELLPADIHFNDAMAVQRRVQVLEGENGPTIRFEGAGLDALDSGAAIADTTVLAYIELVARGDIDELIKDARVEDQYGFMNAETFSVPMLFTVDANVDQVVFSDLESLRDLGGADVLLNPELEVTARAAEAVLTTSSSFDLGTYREVVQVGEGAYTNLVRHGDTIFQASSWRNDGEFSFTDLRIESISDAVAEVRASFDLTGTDRLPSLGWSDQPGEGAVMDLTTSFHIVGEAGSVVDTSAVGYALSAYGDYGWNTTEMEQFQVKHLVTYQGDLNYDGAVTMKDLAFLNAGAAMATNPHDVDADFNGSIDMLDLSVIDADWGKSLHSGDGKFLGSESITMDELFRQDGRRWDSSAFEDQNEIEAGEAGAPAYVNVLTDESNGLINAAGLDSAVVRQWEEQHSQQYALTSV